MSCYLGIDAERGALEIGNTYYVPKLRGTGFNRRVKDLMLARAFGCGFRRVEFRVDSRNGRSQAAMAKIGGVREGVLRAGSDHLDGACPRHRPLLHPGGRMESGRWGLTISSSRSPPG